MKGLTNYCSLQLFLDLSYTTFIIHPSASNFLTTLEIRRKCFERIILERKGVEIQNYLFSFQRLYGHTLRYFRALRAVDRVVEAVRDYRLSDECKKSLLRMTHCDSCAGYSLHSRPCNGLCLNTARGCLIDFGDLVKPIQDFSRALIAMKNSVDVQLSFSQLPQSIFAFISSVSDEFFPILSEVSTTIEPHFFVALYA